MKYCVQLWRAKLQSLWIHRRIIVWPSGCRAIRRRCHCRWWPPRPQIARHRVNTPPVRYAINYASISNVNSLHFLFSESDSAARDSDCSEGMADSVATCLPGNGGSTSRCTSTEIIGGSADLLSQKDASDRDTTFVCPSPKVIPRTKRRHSERPWSVSCLSQLTQRVATTRSSEQIAANQGLANHSISESALHKLNTSGSGTHNGSLRSSDSRSSLKRRRMRLKKKQRSESGSNNSDSSHRRSSTVSISRLSKSESFSGSILTEETVSMAVATDASNSSQANVQSTTSEMESEEDLQKPNFQLGAYTSNTFFACNSATKLGALAPLAYYNPVREPSWGNEDTSNQSEQQAWDDYQDKYSSEAYSEGMDSDAARKLLDFGDDYRKHLDSQSDCCSSLSAANNLDSMSPPRNRKIMPGIMPNGNAVFGKNPSDDDNTMRRRRAHELDIERRRRAFTEGRFRLSNVISLSRENWFSYCCCDVCWWKTREATCGAFNDYSNWIRVVEPHQQSTFCRKFATISY